MNDSTTQIKDATGNPAPLGLLGFGMTTVLLNLHNAGFYELNSMILAMGLCYGGGAQIVVFTTGLGTPTGNPIAPVVKITGNARTAQGMADNIDVDVSGVMSETESLDAAADRLLTEVLAVCSGRPTAAERLGHREFAIHRRNPTI